SSVTGPYEGNKANPVLTHRHLGRGVDVVGVGHADLVEAPDGSWWAVLLAMRTYGGYHSPLGRGTFLVPVVWEDGWPVLAPGEGRVPDAVEVPFAAAAPRTAVQGGASGVVGPDDPRWSGVRALPRDVATPAGQGRDLAVRPTTLAEPGAPAFLGVRQQHRGGDVTVTPRVPQAEGGPAAGGARRSDADHARLLVGRGPGRSRRGAAAHRRGGSATSTWPSRCACRGPRGGGRASSCGSPRTTTCGYSWTAARAGRGASPPWPAAAAPTRSSARGRSTRRPGTR